MGIQNAQKKNLLVIINLSLGAISFLISILPLIQIIMFVNARVVTVPFLERLIVGYSDWIFENSIAVMPNLSFIFGLATLVIGFIASIIIDEKKARGISYIGTILGTLGMVGSTAFVVYFILSWE